jgi:hypothetical protein
MQQQFGDFPSLKPATRKDVVMLRMSMHQALQQIEAEEDPPYPTEMHALLHVVQREQTIYDAAFGELIRQVTINMAERGEMLSELRRRYATLFAKIPREVMHLHTELLVQRKLNKRLTEELLRSRDTTAGLLRELEGVRKHDVEVTKKATEDHHKLVALMTENGSTDDVLEEYHKLYKLQKDRLEETVRITEQEKRLWMDAARSLALRIGKASGSQEIMKLQKCEYARLRCTNHVIVNIYRFNQDGLAQLERRIADWRHVLLLRSQSMVAEDNSNADVLTKIQYNMKMVIRSLGNVESKDEVEEQSATLKMFQVYGGCAGCAGCAGDAGGELLAGPSTDTLAPPHHTHTHTHTNTPTNTHNRRPQTSRAWPST